MVTGKESAWLGYVRIVAQQCMAEIAAEHAPLKVELAVYSCAANGAAGVAPGEGSLASHTVHTVDVRDAKNLQLKCCRGAVNCAAGGAPWRRQGVQQTRSMSGLSEC